MNINHYIISLNSVEISYCRAPEQVAMDRLVELAYRKQLVTSPPLNWKLLIYSSKLEVTYLLYDK